MAQTADHSLEVMPVLAAVWAVVALTISAAVLMVILEVAVPPVEPRRCSFPLTLLVPVVQEPAVSPSGPSVPTAPMTTSEDCARVVVAPDDGVVLVPVVPAVLSMGEDVRPPIL